MTLILEKRNLCGLVFDGIIEETHSKSATVTNFPVGINSPISDHMVAQPTKLTLKGIIGDYIGGTKGGGLSGAGSYIPPSVVNEYLDIPNIKEAINQSSTAVEFRDESPESVVLEENAIINTIRSIGRYNFGSDSIGNTFDPNISGQRARAAWCRLIELMENKEVCTIITGLKKYDNMVVTSIDTKTDKKLADSCKMEATIQLQQIRRVSSQSTTINQLNEGINDKGKINSPCLRITDVFLSNVERSKRDDFSNLVTSNGTPTTTFGFGELNDIINNVLFPTNRGVLTYTLPDGARQTVSTSELEGLSDDNIAKLTTGIAEYFTTLDNTSASNQTTCAITAACNEGKYTRKELTEEEIEDRNKELNERKTIDDTALNGRRFIESKVEVYDAARQFRDEGGRNDPEFIERRLACYSDNMLDLISGNLGIVNEFGDAIPILEAVGDGAIFDIDYGFTGASNPTNP